MVGVQRNHRSPGPVTGGWLIERFSWRWAFYINLPIAAAVLGVLWYRVAESRGEQTTRGIDWTGAVLASAGLGAMVTD